MDVVQVATVVAGALLMFVVLVDVGLTTVHPDVEGPLAERAQRWTWAIAVRLGSGGQRHRRLLALAGPVMMAATFVVWLLAFTVGFALVAYPFIDEAYRAEAGLTELGFVQALYYSGVTVTVLGYGDITPVAWPLQLATFVASASGFALLSGIVTYVIQVVIALNERVHFSLRMADDTEGSGDGADLVLGSVAEEGVDAARLRIGELADMTRDLNDRLHRFPVVALCYRFADPQRDPEPAIKAAIEAAVAARLVSLDDSYGSLGPVARSLERACERLIADLSRQYVGRTARDGPQHDEPGNGARSVVAKIQQRVTEAGIGSSPNDAVRHDIAAFAERALRFLDALDQFTRWRSSQH
jgi:hypothetical protein